MHENNQVELILLGKIDQSVQQQTVPLDCNLFFH